MLSPKIINFCLSPWIVCTVGAISWYQSVADDSRIPKLSVIAAEKKTGSIRKYKKSCADWIVNSEPKLLRNCRFGGNLDKVEIIEFDSSGNWWVSVHGDQVKPCVIVVCLKPNFYSNNISYWEVGVGSSQYCADTHLNHHRIWCLWSSHGWIFQFFGWTRESHSRRRERSSHWRLWLTMNSLEWAFCDVCVLSPRSNI